MPRKTVCYLYFFSFVAVSLVPFWMYNGGMAVLLSPLFIAMYILISEILFRLFYKVKYNKNYQLIPKMPFRRMYIEPHPYLPYVYKKNFICQKAGPAHYPLHQDRKYIFSELRTNNFRHLNGPTGDRDIEVPKPKGLIRINCLGGSTTGNYITYKDRIYSYPLELENALKEAFPDLKIEVNNCGMGGYTSAEVLVKFLLDTIDTEPDIVVLYHAYNDLASSLTSGFQSDYSHAFRNLGEVYHLYKLASKIPNIPLASWNYMVNQYFFSQNIRLSLRAAITRKNPEIKNSFNGLNTYKRNIEHLINICKANHIKVILSTYCLYLYPEIRNDEVHLKYAEGLKLENEVIRKLVLKHDLPLVDNDLLIPREDRYFVDSIHFSPEGMNLLARNISSAIICSLTKPAAS